MRIVSCSNSRLCTHVNFWPTSLSFCLAVGGRGLFGRESWLPWFGGLAMDLTRLVLKFFRPSTLFLFFFFFFSFSLALALSLSLTLSLSLSLSHTRTQQLSSLSEAFLPLPQAGSRFSNPNRSLSLHATARPSLSRGERHELQSRVTRLLFYLLRAPVWKSGVRCVTLGTGAVGSGAHVVLASASCLSIFSLLFVMRVSSGEYRTREVC